jgi:hypothetical protein
MSAAQEAVTDAPAVEAVPKRSLTLGTGTSLIVLAALVLTPLFVKNFIVFQMTMLLVYGLAVLALNILTGGSGQFSLGHCASPAFTWHSRRSHWRPPCRSCSSSAMSSIGPAVCRGWW